MIDFGILSRVNKQLERKLADFRSSLTCVFCRRQSSGKLIPVADLPNLSAAICQNCYPSPFKRSDLSQVGPFLFWLPLFTRNLSYWLRLSGVDQSMEPLRQPLRRMAYNRAMLNNSPKPNNNSIIVKPVGPRGSMVFLFRTATLRLWTSKGLQYV